tara:strand:+ start:202 stop:1191 length:990 start_codon:yes stop_codon:yes gene_type:complete
MIYKSYLVEDNIKILKNNLVLFYGENLGLLKDFKNKIINENSNNTVIKLSQEDIIKNDNILFNQISNKSLFDKNKIIFINEVTDKIIKIIEELHSEIKSDKVYLFAGILEKRSKLRTYFEKSKDCDLVACYKDNEISIRKIITNNLKSYKNLSPLIINLLIDNSGNDRIKLNNEISKIKSFFSNGIIDPEKIENLLNEKMDEDFDLIKDAALKGNKDLTNKLLASIVLELEKVSLYLSKINIRLHNLKDVLKLSKNQNFEESISKIKPPIFWKDKANIIEQAKVWNLNKIINALNKTYKLELSMKSRNDLNRSILFKKLIIDICMLANA